MIKSTAHNTLNSNIDLRNASQQKINQGHEKATCINTEPQMKFFFEIRHFDIVTQHMNETIICFVENLPCFLPFCCQRRFSKIPLPTAAGSGQVVRMEVTVVRMHMLAVCVRSRVICFSSMVRMAAVIHLRDSYFSVFIEGEFRIRVELLQDYAAVNYCLHFGLICRTPIPMRKIC